jgi:hypothetical protein
VTAPLLSLVGRVVIANDGSTAVFDDATVNVDAEKVDVLREIRRLNVVFPAV